MPDTCTAHSTRSIAATTPQHDAQLYYKQVNRPSPADPSSFERQTVSDRTRSIEAMKRSPFALPPPLYLLVALVVVVHLLPRSAVPAVTVNAAEAYNGTRWKPTASDELSWQWQLNGPINQRIDVDVYDVDLFDVSKDTIRSLKRKGKRVICYFSAGTYEGWRRDWRKYFPFIKNERYGGTRPPFAGKMADWDERWLDIGTSAGLLKPIMTSRIRRAVAKGCDAVEVDNVDAYENRGEVKKPITAAQQLRYNRWIASKAHQLGISIGLKNAVGLLKDLEPNFDFAVNEQCFQYKECHHYQIFIGKNKAVFGAEYRGSPADFCPRANAMKLSFQKKRFSLKVWRVGCERFRRRRSL